jgi:HAD superfamily hydrolase (TIGR01509 family)
MSRPLRAVIFDMDGTLWDGEPLFHEAFNVVLAPHGHRVTEEDYAKIIGSSVEAAWQWVMDRFQLTESAQDFYRAYNEAVLKLLQAPAEPLPGVRSLLAKLRRMDVPIGLASADLGQWVDAALLGLGLVDAFEITVSASDVQRSKPAPDVYLAAAKALAVPAGECMAVEDTTTGIAAAKAAGMFAVQIRAASTALPPIAQADLVIDDYSQFDLSLLLGRGSAT